MKKQTKPSLGWRLRDTISVDPRWRLHMLMLSRPPSTKLAGFERLPRGTYTHTVTFARGARLSMLAVEIPTAAQTKAAVASEIDPSLRASGYDGSWSTGPDRTCGIWTRSLRSARDAVEELARTATGAARKSLDTKGIRGREALLEAVRAGAFGRLELYAAYSHTQRLRAVGVSTTLQMMLSAGDQGVGFTFTSEPVRLGASDRSAITTELERLHLDADWSKVPGSGFMLSGRLLPLGIGGPQTSIVKAVAAATDLRRWAEQRR